MKKRIYILIVLSVLVLAFYSCGKKEEAPLVYVESGDDTISYTVINPTIDDVIKTASLDCTYMQTKEQEVCFDSTGKYVDKVYVSKGDSVKKGDLLCELSYDSLEEEIEKLTYKIQRNLLLLSYTETNEELAIQDQWVPTINNPYIDKDDVKKAVEEIRKDFDRQRVLINDSLEFDMLELEKKQTELNNSRLFASMDGIVYSIEKDLEGSTSRADKVIMTIVDNTDCLFTIDDIQYKKYFNDGEKIDMKVSYGKAQGEYIIEPYNYDEWDDKLTFSVFDSPEGAVLEVGARGSVTITVDERKNALTLPKTVIRNVEDRFYVYVLNEENVREIRYIEIGLTGDTNVEILGGLTEGDKVVKK